MLSGRAALFIGVENVRNHLPSPAEFLPSNDLLAGNRFGITLIVVQFELEGIRVASP
jgi:hypothetical protein